MTFIQYRLKEKHGQHWSDMGVSEPGDDQAGRSYQQWHLDAAQKWKAKGGAQGARKAVPSYCR